MIRPDDEELTIETNGRILGGWTRLSVTRGVDLLPSHFDVELTENAPGQASKAVVVPGATCVVKLGKDKVLTGYIDRYMPHYDKDTHRVRIVGRSKTEDIVDCAVDVDKLVAGENGSWAVTAKTIVEAAKILVKPYGIDVKHPDGDADLPTAYGVFHIFPGYSAYQVIEEMARATEMLVWDDADGNLVLSHGGTGGRAATSLSEGQNIEVGEAIHTMDQRFSRYLVMSQAGADFGHTDTWAQAFDRGVPRDRLKIIMVEAPYKEEFQQKRANWEMHRRYGRSLQTIISVTGWRDGAGQLWRPNTIVHITAPNLKIDADRTISEVSWMRDEQGTHTRITVMPTEGLNPRPFEPVDRAGIS